MGKPVAENCRPDGSGKRHSFNPCRTGVIILVVHPGGLIQQVPVELMDKVIFQLLEILPGVALPPSGKNDKLMNKPVILKSIVTCPHCGHREEETMLTDSCLYFYECKNCRRILRPHPGDCCVFCSFGTVKCPPVQKEDRCCSGK